MEKLLIFMTLSVLLLYFPNVVVPQATQLSSTLFSATTLPTHTPTPSSSLCTPSIPSCANCISLNSSFFPSSFNNISCIFTGLGWEWYADESTGGRVIVTFTTILAINTTFTFQAFYLTNVYTYGTAVVTVTPKVSLGSIVTLGSSQVIVTGDFTANYLVAISGDSSLQVQGNFYNNFDAGIINTTASMLVTGNYMDTSSSVFCFAVCPSNSTKLVVTGDVQFTGIIQLYIPTQLPQGSVSFTLITFGSGTTPSLTNSQIRVLPVYALSNCDTISTQIVNQPGKIGVTVSTTHGNNCGGSSTSGSTTSTSGAARIFPTGTVVGLLLAFFLFF